MKKVISVILAIAVVVLSLSACSSKKDDAEFNIDLKFTYDSIYSDFDESSIRAYNDLCKAVLDYKEEVRINTAMLDDVLQLFYTSCPFYALTESVNVNSDNSGFSISYKFDKKTTQEKIKQFNDKIVEIEKECGLGKVSDSFYTLNAYNYVSKNMNVVETSTLAMLDTVLEGKGNIFVYASLFEYLLLQKDIMAFHIIAEDAVGTGWGLSSARLNGNIYYFDMATEHYSNGGNGINYFAMNSNDVKNEGLKNLKYSSQGSAFESVASDFNACRTAKEWSLEGSTLKIVQYDLSEITIDLK